MLIIEINKIQLIRGHIGIMLIIEIANLEFTGGHIGIMLIIDCQNRRWLTPLDAELQAQWIV